MCSNIFRNHVSHTTWYIKKYHVAFTLYWTWYKYKYSTKLISYLTSSSSVCLFAYFYVFTHRDIDTMCFMVSYTYIYVNGRHLLLIPSSMCFIVSYTYIYVNGRHLLMIPPSFRVINIYRHWYRSAAGIVCKRAVPYRPLHIYTRSGRWYDEVGLGDTMRRSIEFCMIDMSV